MIAKTSAMNRAGIKAVFRRHRGEAAKLASELGIDQQNITDWMKGRGKSARVDSAVRSRAAELLAREERAA